MKTASGDRLDPSGAAAAEGADAAPVPAPNTCRLCWGEADDGFGGQLLAPCACRGSLRFIHSRCLAEWRRTLRGQGLWARAARCELCRQDYSVGPGADADAWEELDYWGTAPGGGADAAGGARRPGRRRARRAVRPRAAAAAACRGLAAAARSALADAACARRWPALALELWQSWLLAEGLMSALRAGAHGLAAGANAGRALASAQASALTGGNDRGSAEACVPCPDLIWCQAAGALLVCMATEVLDLAILGCIGGLAYGFAAGYCGALLGSARAARAAARGVAAAAARVLRLPAAARVALAVARRL